MSFNRIPGISRAMHQEATINVHRSLDDRSSQRVSAIGSFADATDAPWNDRSSIDRL
jgi:hypothetical protein